jgi:hypothetical protein
MCRTESRDIHVGAHELVQFVHVGVASFLGTEIYIVEVVHNASNGLSIVLFRQSSPPFLVCSGEIRFCVLHFVPLLAEITDSGNNNHVCPRIPIRPEMYQTVLNIRCFPVSRWRTIANSASPGHRTGVTKRRHARARRPCQTQFWWPISKIRSGESPWPWVDRLTHSHSRYTVVFFLK